MTKEFTGVYIMGNDRPTLYVGVSNNIIRRVLEHKQRKLAGFTKKYGLTKLLHYEFIPSIFEAIYREKVLKRFLRQEKLELIKNKNPLLADISVELFSLVDGIDAIVTFVPDRQDPPCGG